MFLKRLELKGFKSFADKSVLTLEPGISAIVGPNGSGKSNICDAILWVLGERNAKSLRGGVMEDVIFAGSSKRHPVSIAEVSLVLDNSDGTLPIEYNEVSVSRRLYRSGDNEYLINGVTSRRLDVLDILHDSGIGTDTNSIISQGHLDSILKSKPLDRRTLIEEAAGVLKHKQRKIRSQHKLDRMDANLERINDVMAEIERQLKPLRIKAKRAAAYDGLVEELSSLNLEISVDDLKKIKAKWDKAEAKKNEIQKSVDEKREDYKNKSEHLKELQQKISSQNSDVVEYSDKQRRLSSSIEKFSTYRLLMSEKHKNAKQDLLDLTKSDNRDADVSAEKQSILDEINALENKTKILNNEDSELRGQTETARKLFDEAKTNFDNAQKEFEEYNEQLRKHQKELADYRTKITEINDNAVESQTKIASAKSKIEDLQKQLSQKEDDLNKAQKDLKEKEEIQNDIEKQHKDIQEQLLKAQNNKDEKDKEIENLKLSLSEINADMLAAQSIINAEIKNSSKAQQWFHENIKDFPGIANISDKLDAADEYIPLLELLLGDFSDSYFATQNDIDTIKTAIVNNDNPDGSLNFIDNNHMSTKDDLCSQVDDFAKQFNGEPLYKQVKLTDGSSLNAIINTVIFENYEQAFKASKNTNSICCVSFDGSIIYPDGRCIISSPFKGNKKAKSASKSTLAYKKELKKLNKNADKNSKKLDSLIKDAENYKKDLDSLQQADLDLKNKITTANAELDFARKYCSELQSSVESIKDELEKSKQEEESLVSSSGNISPEIEKCKSSIRSLNELIQKDEEILSSMQKDIFELRQDNDTKLKELNSLEVKSAALKERIKSQEDNILNAKERLKNQEKNEVKNISKIEKLKTLIDVYGSFAGIFENLELFAKKDLSKLDEKFGTINSDALNINAESNKAIEESNEARKKFDKENQNLSDINVELGKLEIQVQNAVDVIDKIDGISVDKALEMPDIENRDEKEDRAFKIRRRIANMGPINTDAKQEYELLKERFDFLNKQVQDLKAAKISLSKIDKIIDSRMKDDFINTFDEVNANFKEIFSVLFPGGKAKLELENKDDIENTGVEVKAQPYGKSISKMSLLSGGEKSLVALCLLFAVYKKRSTPFYILDEVEAALDDTNLRRLIKYLQDLREYTQLIMITHQRRTMEMADVLYGVSMKDDGVTKVVSQKLGKDNKLHDIDK